MYLVACWAECWWRYFGLRSSPNFASSQVLIVLWALRSERLGSVSRNQTGPSVFLWASFEEQYSVVEKVTAMIDRMAVAANPSQSGVD